MERTTAHRGAPEMHAVLFLPLPLHPTPSCPAASQCVLPSTHLPLFLSLIAVHSDTSSTSPNSGNPARLIPASLTGRPEPLHLALASPWMSNTAQAPHRRTYRNIPVPPIDSMPLSSKREPNKRTGSLLIRRIHWARCPPSSARPNWTALRAGANITGAARLRESVPAGCVPHAQGKDVREPQRTSRTPPPCPG